MSDFVDAGLAKIEAAYSALEKSNLGAHEIAKVIFEHVEEWLGKAVKTPPAPKPDKEG